MSSSTQSSSATAGQECGYDMNFEPELDSKYKCPVCLVAMKNAVQTKCGHRFCKTCLKQCSGSVDFSFVYLEELMWSSLLATGKI